MQKNWKQNLVWKEILFYVFCLKICQLFIISKGIQNYWKIMVRYWKSYRISFKILQILNVGGLRPTNSPLCFDSACLVEVLFYSLLLKHYPFYLAFPFWYYIFDSKNFPANRHAFISAFKKICAPPLTFRRGASPVFKVILVK